MAFVSVSKSVHRCHKILILLMMSSTPHSQTHPQLLPHTVCFPQNQVNLLKEISLLIPTAQGNKAASFSEVGRH